MAVPDFQTLMLPLLKTAQDSDRTVSEYVDALTIQFNLSDEEKSLTIPSGKQSLIRNRAQWAATYLVKAGLLERPSRGCVRITGAGKEALKNNPAKIDIDYLLNFESFKSFRNAAEQDNSLDIDTDIQSTGSTPEDLIASAYKSYEKTSREEILELILSSSPAFFERLIIDLFKAMGYGGKGQSTHVGKSGDGGIDGIIDEDPLGLEKVYLQAKRYTDARIGVEQIRSFAGSLDERGARKGIFVTTSSFATGAYEYAERSPKSLVLIDGEKLTKLMYEYDVGVRTVQTISIKKPDIDYFEDL